MKTIILEEPGNFRISNTPIPQLTAPNSALVRVLKVGICGTDLHAYKGEQPFFSYPRVLGHELAVEILELNSESNFKKGDICAVRPYMNCGKCIACRRGISNACENLQVMGVHYDGGMQEIISVPLSHLHLAQGIPAQQLALVEMLSIGAHAVRRAKLDKGENVLVIGAGPIGIGTAQFARMVGANVALMDINSQRLAFCKDVLKFEHTIDANKTPKERLLDIFDGDLPTAVFDATGNSASMHHAFQYLAHGAKLIFIGLFKGDISFHEPYFHSHELTILASRNATPEDFDWVIASLKNKDFLLDALVTHTSTAEQLIVDFPKWLDPETGVIKAILEF